jgi:aminopeptidase N
MLFKPDKNVYRYIILIFLFFVSVRGQDKSARPEIKPAIPFLTSSVIPDTVSGFDVLHYRLNLNFPYRSSAFSGIVKMKCLSRQDNLNTVSFDMVDLTADSVCLRGAKTAFNQVQELIDLSIAPAIQKDDTFSVTIYYHGAPDEIGFYFYDRCAYTFTEPVFSRYWFPCHDVPWDKATAELFVTVPKGIEVASIGVLKSRELSPDHFRETFHWQTEYPVATYLICITMSEDYAHWSDWYVTGLGDSIEMAYYIFREDSADGVKDFVNMVDAITFYSDRFGEYPFEKYGMAEVKPFPIGGMEHQTMTTINSDWLQGNRSYEDGLVHELAHMWWGDAVTLNDWPAIWLNEGFASYSEALYGEHKGGANVLKADMEHFKNIYLDQAVQEDFPIYNPGWVELFNWGIIYKKGAWVLHMLRHVIGDENFWTILNRYYETYKYGNASIADFQTVCETVTGMDLSWFFDEWLYQAGYPKLQTCWNGRPVEGNRYEINIDIEQIQTVGPVFKMPIDLRISLTEGNHDTTIWIENEKDVFSFRLNSEPLSVSIDPDGWVLLESEMVPWTYLRSNDTPDRYQLYPNFPNPFNGTTWIDYNIPKIATESTVTITIYNLQGGKVITLLKRNQREGCYRIDWDGKDATGTLLPSGVYLIELSAGTFKKQLKAVLIK